MNVLSLFDGMSCGRIALKLEGINVKRYYASEIKKHAIKCSKYNNNDVIHIGDVTKISYKNGILYTEKGKFQVGKIDILMGGSPCQDFSILKVNGKGLEGDKSKLFYEYLRLLKEIKPKYFLLENVKMKKESKEQLDNYLETEGVFINSIDFSYQNRPRFYWTNIKILPYESKDINFQDYIGKFEENLDDFKVNRTPSRERMWNNGEGKNNIGNCANVTNSKQIYCITRKQDRCPNSGLIQHDDFCRYLSRRELEKGQNIPLGYTDCLSYNQAQDLLGDGWTVDVIRHILKGLKENENE